MNPVPSVSTAIGISLLIQTACLGQVQMTSDENYPLRVINKFGTPILQLDNGGALHVRQVVADTVTAKAKSETCDGVPFVTSSSANSIIVEDLWVTRIHENPDKVCVPAGQALANPDQQLDRTESAAATRAPEATELHAFDQIFGTISKTEMSGKDGEIKELKNRITMLENQLKDLNEMKAAIRDLSAKLNEQERRLGSVSLRPGSVAEEKSVPTTNSHE